jgi:hypothetical protein
MILETLPLAFKLDFAQYFSITLFDINGGIRACACACASFVASVSLV